ncbi:MAG: TylF/MycF family methyltransferase [Planctomycetes bacterium]|nr:TylF/MycF family methyltransferase [Planctomycetota bacterium]
MKLPKLGAPKLDQIINFFMPVFWGTRDDAQVETQFRQVAANVAPGIHFADNFFTWGRNNSMLDDAEFMKSWESNALNMTDKGILWRRYVLACAAYHCVQLDGDFVECGAYTGTAVKTVMDYLGGPAFPKTFWAYDLFEHNEAMLHHSLPAHGKDLHEQVKHRFRDYPQVRIIKGFIPDVFAEHAPDKIAYMHIDMNQAPAELAALEGLFDRMVPAGILVLDDYEWTLGYRGQKLAEDPWFEARGYRVMPLPTGQGLVIKR